MKKNSPPSVSISFVTLNYNGKKETLELLNSIYGTIHSVSFEVIVVDNASGDRDEINEIAEKFPLCITTQSDKNLGFAGGNNIGIELANGQYVMLINNDTFIKEDHFDALTHFFENNPAVGAISPKILFSEPFGHIQFAGYTPLSSITMRNSLRGFSEPDNGQYDTPCQTPYCHGAAMMVRKDVIEKVGKMYEGYFLYYEELDWSSMIARAGYQLWYVPYQTIYHKESSTIGADSPTKTYYLTRNRLLYVYRNGTRFKKHLSVIYQLIVAIPKGVFISLLKGNFKNAKAIVQGGFDYFSLNKK